MSKIVTPLTNTQIDKAKSNDKKHNHFFSLVWRVNSLIIFVAGLLAIAILAFVFYQVGNEVTRERIIDDYAVVEKATGNQ